MKKQLFQKIITYFIIMLMVVTAAGIGMENDSRDTITIRYISHSSFTNQKFTYQDDLHNYELRDDTTGISSILTGRSAIIRRGEQRNLLYLILFFVFACVCRFWRLTHLRYNGYCNWDWMRVIIFIHNMDGRKRFVYSR